MNIYLFTAIEIVIYTSIAYFLGRQIGIFTSNDELVNLNYIFWGIFALLSLLANLKLYLYFGSALVISILVLIIYIYKEVTVGFFVEKEMNMYFWILFGIFMITITLLIISKKMMLMAFNSEPPRGDSGPRGETGIRGKSFFIEPAGDRVYVYVVKQAEAYFRDILDTNDVYYDKNEYQFNNMYLKQAISRITNSQQFICSIMQSHDPNVYECAYDSNRIQLPSQMVYSYDMKEIVAQITRNSACKLGAISTTGDERNALWICDGQSYPIYIENNKIKMIDSSGTVCVLGHESTSISGTGTDEYQAKWFCDENDDTRGNEVYIRNDKIYTNISQTGTGTGTDDNRFLTGSMRCALVWHREVETDGNYNAKWDCTGQADSVEFVDISDESSPTEAIRPDSTKLDRACRPQLSPERLQGGYNEQESINYRTNPACIEDSTCGHLGHVALENLDIERNRDVTNIVNEVKTWINYILENTCEDDRKLRQRLKYNKYVSIDQIAPDEDLIPNFYHPKNQLRLNNPIGRRFLQSHFENDRYWLNNNVKAINPKNPFKDYIHRRPRWKWGTPDAPKMNHCVEVTDNNTCNFR